MSVSLQLAALIIRRGDNDTTTTTVDIGSSTINNIADNGPSGRLVSAITGLPFFHNFLSFALTCMFLAGVGGFLFFLITGLMTQDERKRADKFTKVWWSLVPIGVSVLWQPIVLLLGLIWDFLV